MDGALFCVDLLEAEAVLLPVWFKLRSGPALILLRVTLLEIVKDLFELAGLRGLAALELAGIELASLRSTWRRLKVASLGFHQDIARRSHDFRGRHVSEGTEGDVW